MFFKLLKVFLKENFGARRLFGDRISRSKGKSILFIFLFVYAFGAVGVSTGLMFYTMDVDRILLGYIASYAVGLGFLLSFFQANGFLFQFKDYEILGSLPIKPLSVFLAKLAAMLVFTYIFIFFLTAPIIVVYYMRAPFDILGFIYLVLGFIVLPLPAIIAGSFLSLLIAKISKRFAKSNLIQTILMFAIFLIIFVASMAGSLSAENGSFIPAWVIDAISSVYLPNEWFTAAVHEQNALNFLFLFLSHAAFFIAFVMIISRLSVKTNQNRASGKEVIIKDRHLKRTPVFWALLHKEWRRFVGTPIYIFNCAMGLMMLIILSIASLIFKAQIAEAVGEFAPYALLALFAFCLSTVYTPAVNLSLEGKNFALLKTLPIKGETIVAAKTIFNLVLEVPIILVCLPLAAIACELDVWTALASLLAIISFAVLSSIFFAWLNLLFPRFDFKNEAEVIKQSMSAFLAVFGSFGLIIIDGLIIFALWAVPFPSIALPFLILTIANGLIAFALYLPLHRLATAKIQKLEV